MAVSISSVKFSFHRFEPVSYYLPAYRQFDAAFQFLVNNFLPINNKINLGVIDSSGVLRNVFGSTVYASVVSYKMKIPEGLYNSTGFYLQSILAGSKLLNYNREVSFSGLRDILLDDFGFSVELNNTFLQNELQEIIIRFSADAYSAIIENTLQAFWGTGYVQGTGDLIFPNFKPGECFQYVLLDESGTMIGKTNRLSVLNSHRFTSLLSYSNNESGFDFTYTGQQANIVRLPFYCSRPQWPEKKSAYIKSNGRHKLLSAFVEETYSLRTEYMIKELHRFLKIALQHDNIFIDCKHMIETPAEVINLDSYNPTWDEESDLDTAQGKCTITVAGFGYNNSNCDMPETNCPPPILSIGTAGEGSVNLNFQLPSRTKKIAVNYRKVGTSEWEIQIIEAVASYTLTGLDAGSDYEIRVSSDCGSSFGDFGRIHTFRTFGELECDQVTDLTFVSYSAFAGRFHLTVMMPAVVPPNLELLVIKPDGYQDKLLISTNDFTSNPYLMSYPESNLQTGIYRFKIRSKCAEGSYSLYSNEASYNNVSVILSTELQYDFNCYYANTGFFEILRPINSVVRIPLVRATEDSNGILTLVNGSAIKVTVRSDGEGFASLKITERISGTIEFENTPGTDKVVTHTFNVTDGSSFLITSSIQS